MFPIRNNIKTKSDDSQQTHYLQFMHQQIIRLKQVVDKVEFEKKAMQSYNAINMEHIQTQVNQINALKKDQTQKSLQINKLTQSNRLKQAKIKQLQQVEKYLQKQAQYQQNIIKIKAEFQSLQQNYMKLKQTNNQTIMTSIAQQNMLKQKILHYDELFQKKKQQQKQIERRLKLIKNDLDRKNEQADTKKQQNQRLTAINNLLKQKQILSLQKQKQKEQRIKILSKELQLQQDKNKVFLKQNVQYRSKIMSYHSQSDKISQLKKSHQQLLVNLQLLKRQKQQLQIKNSDINQILSQNKQLKLIITQQHLSIMMLKQQNQKHEVENSNLQSQNKKIKLQNKKNTKNKNKSLQTNLNYSFFTGIQNIFKLIQ